MFYFSLNYLATEFRMDAIITLRGGGMKGSDNFLNFPLSEV